MVIKKNQSKTPIIDQLSLLSTQPDAAFYAPGHKRGQGINPILANLLGDRLFKADLPELPELDNLFAPRGVIAQAQSLAAEAFGASHTWFLVNGSTCGIIAAILATCQEGDKIILPRNSHRSVISGLILSGAMPIFLPPEYYPHWDLAASITPEAVASTLAQHPDAKAVLVVYPTYQGICTDLGAIVSIAHSYDVPVLVDEAHGAHLHFHPDLPPSALSVGADLSVQSAHKTLGALSQASFLHLQGNRIDKELLNQALSLVQSTSPSYPLLASLDAARQQMALQGRELLTQTLHLAQSAKNNLNQLSGLQILTQEQLPPYYQLDPTRLTVFLSNLPLCGYEVDTWLRTNYKVTAELPLKKSLTFIISIGNTQADIQALTLGLQGILQNLPQKSQNIATIPYSFPILTQCQTPRAAFLTPKKIQPLTQAVGEISAELVCPYPPGIPILLPGEKITREAIDYLLAVKAAGAVLTGCHDENLQQIATLIT